MKKTEVDKLKTGIVVKSKYTGLYVLGSRWIQQEDIWHNGRMIHKRQAFRLRELAESWVQNEEESWLESKDIECIKAFSIEDLNKKSEAGFRTERMHRAIRCHALRLEKFVFDKTGANLFGAASIGYGSGNRYQRDQILKLALALGWKED